MIFIMVLIILFIYFLYKYFYNFIKHFNLKMNKILALFISIIIFVLSIVLLFFNKYLAIVSVLLFYSVLFYFIVLLINIVIKNYKLWNKVYLFIPIILSIGFVIYGYFNMKNIVFKEYNIQSDKLNSNYKIALISDLHYGVSLNENELKQVADEINSINVDFVLLLGDIVDEKTTYEEMEDAFNILGNIKNKYGIYYIYGNHDKNAYSYKKNYSEDILNKTIENNNIRILEEEKKYIGNDIVLIGRGFDKKYDINDLIDDNDLELYKIVMDHVPNCYDNNVDLLLSGHTHNGQIFPLGIVSRLFKINKYNYGQYKDNDVTIIVSSGIAGWDVPIRTEGHSEYVIVNLNK